ncbi:hypothetical protein SESBI_08944 [Sesbania bispinosa]|nr:hypothetical protein SESBI_08944 [Sesbania bispinosa]
MCSCNLLPDDVIEEILANPCPRAELGPDNITWGGTSHGAFSTRSTYDVIVNPVPHAPEQAFCSETIVLSIHAYATTGLQRGNALSSRGSRYKEELVRWTFPNPGWVKINVDGSVRQGGVFYLRNSELLK